MNSESNDSLALWVNKYAPKSIDDIVMSKELRKHFKSVVESGTMASMTFIGPQGSGKTTLAKCLCREFGADTLFVPCAVEGSIDILRTKIKDFCESMSMEGKLKIVILDEVDSASSSGESNFQKGLRNVMELYSASTRFILTANNDTIIPAVLSRAPVLPLGFDEKDLLLRVRYIMDNEKVSYDKESLKDFIRFAFKFYPDVRRIVNYLQGCCSSGKLVVGGSAVAQDGDLLSFIKDMVARCKTDKILDVRQFVVRSKSRFEGNYLKLAENTFNYLVDERVVSDKGRIMKLVDTIYMMNQTINKEITFCRFLSVICENG